jgi:hypothetical protein
MVSIELINMKQDENKQYQMYKPTKTNLSKYEIIFNTKSNKYIQFVLFVKYVNSIKISQPKTQNILEYSNFPYNGIVYSCLITHTNPLIIEIDPMDLCSRIIIKKQIVTHVNKINLNPITWDKIFIINLARRPDRKKSIEKFFTAQNIPCSDYEFIEAYDGQSQSVITQYESNKKSNPSNPIITPGHFACLLSHLKAIQLAKSRGYKKIMILEDDVFTNESNLTLKLKSIQVPEYDLLYLGGIMSKKKCFTSGWAWSGGTYIMGAYGYILSSELFDHILLSLSNLDEYIDFYYLKNIQSQYMTICLEDVIKTDLTTSDTSHKSRIMVKRLDMIKK